MSEPAPRTGPYGVATRNIIALSSGVVGGATTCDLVTTLLLRAGENPATTLWAPAALHYINRAYLALARGGAEFDPTSHTDPVWVRKVPPGVLALDPERGTSANGMTAQVTQNSTTVGLSQVQSSSVQGWAFRVTQPASAVYRVASHSAGSSTLVLDAPYAGTSGAAVPLWLRHYDYALATDVLRLIEPLFALTGTGAQDIRLTSDAATLMQWPRLEAGVTSRYAEIGRDPSGAKLVRFDRVPAASEGPLRVEYAYSFLVAPLTDLPGGACTEVPLCPAALRWTLVDLALYLMWLDKNDSRADAAVIVGKQGIAAQHREQVHVQAVSGVRVGASRWPRGQRGPAGGWPPGPYYGR